MFKHNIHESEYGDSPKNFHVHKSGDELIVTLTYPPYEGDPNPLGKCRYVHLDQESVRASDGIRIHYDYARDGFVIEQASTFQWEADDQVCDPDWQEVAFIQSWAREKEEVPEESLRVMPVIANTTKPIERHKFVESGSRFCKECWYPYNNTQVHFPEVYSESEM